MIHFSDNEDLLLGFYQANLNVNQVRRKVSRLLEIDLDLSESEHYSDLSFDTDTLIVNRTIFTEDLLELIDFGIMIHIVDY